MKRDKRGKNQEVTMKMRKPSLATVLKEVNRARTAMGMEPLKRMPMGLPGGPDSSLAHALGASGTIVDGGPCPRCQFIAGRVAVIHGCNRVDCRKDPRFKALWRLWGKPDYTNMGTLAFRIHVPEVLARFHSHWSRKAYPTLIDPDCEKIVKVCPTLGFAIFALGGVDATARTLKMTRQHFTQTLRKKPLDQWELQHVAALAAALHISVDLLLRTDRMSAQPAPSVRRAARRKAA